MNFAYFIHLVLCSADFLSADRLHLRDRSEIVVNAIFFSVVGFCHIRVDLGHQSLLQDRYRRVISLLAVELNNCTRNRAHANRALVTHEVVFAFLQRVVL